MIKPIYLFSLPRSGSTMLQRILACSPDIASASEPWLLLPFIYALREHGTKAEYAHLFAYWGMSEFIETLPQGRKSFDEQLGKFITSLYAESAQSNSKYFLDKTPRYHVISEDIIQVFKTEAKYIYLWRHPLAVAASIINASEKKRWNLFLYKIDLYSGIDALIKSHQKNKEISIALKYEDLIEGNTAEVWRKLFAYLEIEFDEKFLSDFSSVTFSGTTMGDKTGVSQYKKIDNRSIEVWKTTLNNPIRKWWARRYLRWLGEERLSAMGYNLGQIQAELRAVPTGYSNLLQDLFMIVVGELRGIFILRSIWTNLLKIGRNDKIVNEEY